MSINVTTNSVVNNNKEENKMNKHLNNHKVISALKSHEGNGLAYCLRALPQGKMGFRMVLDTTMAEINPLTRHYLVQNVPFQNLAKREVITKRGFVNYCVLDVNAMAESNSSIHRQMAVALMSAELFIGRDPKTGKIVVVWNNAGTYQVISDGIDKAGNIRSLKRSVIFDDNGNVRGDWMRFKSHKNFGASKGRKHLMDMFAEGGNFADELNEATYGESALSFNGEEVTAKEMADKLTRIGSKGTRMGSMGTIVYNVLISFKNGGKDDCTDGTGLHNARNTAEQVVTVTGMEHTSKLEKSCEGYIQQERPDTVKGAPLTVSEQFLAAKARQHKIYTIDVNNLTAEDREIADLILDKVYGNRNKAKLTKIKNTKLAGYDAIGLVGDPSRGWDLYGDLNFFKDRWDYTKKSGMNILNVAHFDGDFMSANTSGQMFKVVMRAIADNCDTAFRKEADEAIKSIIEANVAEAMDLTAKPQKFDGAGLLDVSYAPGVYTMLNKDSYTNNPSIFMGVVSDKVNTADKMINGDRYKVPGHSAMITVGVDYWLSGESVLKVYEDNLGRNVVEVYDPVANRYFDENGIDEADRYGVAIKYPAMGTREFLILKYISEEEYVERVINALNASDEDKKLIVEAIKNFKEGGMMIPAALNIVAWFAAGSDEDGDKVTALFTTKDGKDIATVIIRSGLKPRAVVINPPNSGAGLKGKMNEEAFAKYASWQVLGGNKSVGIVTNTFRIFTEGLQNDLNDPEVLSFYTGLLIKLGASANGKNNYKSVIDSHVDETTGIAVFETDADAMAKFLAAIKNVKLDAKNIRAILEDMDVLGRHCQELTIDAQKKFYEVMCKWMDKVRNYSIFPLKFGIKMSMQYFTDKRFHAFFSSNKGYKVTNNTTVSTVAKVITEDTEFGTNYIMADKFSEYRVYAANLAMEKLVDMVDMLNDVMDEYLSNKDAREAEAAMLKMRINHGALHQMYNIIKDVWAIDTMKKNAEEALANELRGEMSSLNAKLATKLAEDIRKSINAQYAEAIAYVDNEIRACYSAWKIAPEDAVKYFDSCLKIQSSTANKILKEERFIAMANASDTPNFEKKISNSIGECLEANNVSTVTVWNGAIMMFSMYGEDPIVGLMDGEYNVVARDGKYYLSRPYAEFVTIPAVDNNVRTIGQFVNTVEDAEKLDAALIAGEEYTIVEKKNRNGNTYYLADAAGNMVVEMYFGKNDKVDGMMWKERALLSKHYVGFTGKLIAKTVNTLAKTDENGVLRCNYIITLQA